ncbi:hypothetical protein RQP46_004296 [Phenoliferia psychrophenolica]
MAGGFASQSLFPAPFDPSQSGSPDSEGEDDLGGQDDVDELADAGGEETAEVIRTLGSLKRSRTNDDDVPPPPPPGGSGTNPLLPPTRPLVDPAAADPTAPPPPKQRKTRGSKACVECRKVKARCLGSAQPPCQRCVASGAECVFTASRRGKRNPKPTTTGELASSLSKLEATFSNAASRRNTKYSMSLASILQSSEAVGEEEDQRVLAPTRLGLANKSYFQPNPLNILPLRGVVFSQRVPSQILTKKLLSTEAIVELFDLYFTHLHPHYAVLNPDIHTPTATSLRSPFLFSCICTVASRFYKKRTDDLYRECLRVTKSSSANLLANGWKSTEVVQGFLLLSHWNQPAETYEQELTYQYSGMAIRMANDLNLQRQATATLPDNVTAEGRNSFIQEVLNRERSWLHCFITDRSISTQMGKPSCIGSREDLIIRSAKEWCKQPGIQPSDVSVSAIVELHRVVGRILTVLHTDGAGMPKNMDYPALTDMFLGLLETWHDDWTSHNVTVGSTLREFYYHYYRLFVLSFAVQHALDDPTSGIDLPGYCLLCCQAIKELIHVSKSLLEQGILGYATDTTFTCLSYGAVFLLKLASPTFSRIIHESSVFSQVTEVAEILDRCAADPTHTPALYAAFIRALLESRRDPHRSTPASRMATRAGTPSTPPVPQSAPEMGHILEPWSEAFEMIGVPYDDTSGPQGLGLPDELNELAVNSLVSNNDFWHTMLMPGFGGPLAGLAGGNGLMFSGDANDFSTPYPMYSRPPSPHPADLRDLPFDFLGDAAPL